MKAVELNKKNEQLDALKIKTKVRGGVRGFQHFISPSSACNKNDENRNENATASLNVYETNERETTLR